MRNGAGCADYCHRRVLFPAECRAADLERLRPVELPTSSVGGQRDRSCPLRRRRCASPMLRWLPLPVCILIMVAADAVHQQNKNGYGHARSARRTRDAARLMGINVDATISVTFAIGSGLAAVAGVLLLLGVSDCSIPTTGSMPGIKAFTAAVFGGIGSIPGALLGGLLLGVIEIMAEGVHLHADVGRRGVRGADHRAARQAVRSAGQAGPRESVRWVR